MRMPICHVKNDLSQHLLEKIHKKLLCMFLVLRIVVYGTIPSMTYGARELCRVM